MMKSYINSIFIFLALCMCSIHYAAELPPFVEKYNNAIPCLEYDGSRLLSSQEKAMIISRYLCLFIPQQKKAVIKGSIELEKKLEYLISHKKQISLLLLGFPFKSTNNEKKCLGKNVDLGEYFALATLNKLVQNIKSLHSDTHCTIVSDGLAYHIDGYDPSYEDIFNYHEAMANLTTHFDNVSFVSWKINSKLKSYQVLQKEVLAISIEEDDEKNKKRYQEMKTFVSNEFKCTHWENIFLQKAQTQYTGNQEKPKLRDQEIKTLKNSLIAESTKCIVPQLVCKGKQFSTLVSQAWPHYDECIRLSVHCDKDIIDVSTKIPINLICGHQGTPWHNAVVIDDKNNELQGFAKDIFNKKLNLTMLSQNSLSIQNQKISLSLSYITH